MLENVRQQQTVHEERYALEQKANFEFHITHDPFTRYLRDRRLVKGIDVLKANYQEIQNWQILIVCGGVGGEGIFFLRNGFNDVTVSDISENSLKICNLFEPAIKTIKLNGELLDLPDNSYDLVVVQDGLHHLPRPVSGFTEMLRVAKKAIMVIEPHESLIGDLLGTEWELTGDSVNYVFRWNKQMVAQTVKSFLLKNYKKIKVMRFWDHSLSVYNLACKAPGPWRLRASKLIYAMFKPIDGLGNMMVAVVLK